MVILSWLFPTVFYFLIAVILTNAVPENIVNTFKITRVFVFQIAPCVSLLLATIQIFIIARKHSKKMASIAGQLKFNYPISDKKPKDESDISSARFIGVVVLFMVICYTADSYLDLRSYLSSFRKTIDTDYVLCLLFLTNSAINPLAYALFKPDIKKQVKRLLNFNGGKMEGVEGRNIFSTKPLNTGKNER